MKIAVMVLTILVFNVSTAQAAKSKDLDKAIRTIYAEIDSKLESSNLKGCEGSAWISRIFTHPCKGFIEEVLADSYKWDEKLENGCWELVENSDQKLCQEALRYLVHDKDYSVEGNTELLLTRIMTQIYDFSLDFKGLAKQLKANLIDNKKRIQELTKVNP